MWRYRGIHPGSHRCRHPAEAPRIRGSRPRRSPAFEPRARRSTARLPRVNHVTAYEQLAGEGISSPACEAGRGSILTWRSVRALLPRPTPPLRPASATPTMLRPGAPLEAVTSSAWRAAWQAAAGEPHAYPSPGSPRLRHLLAEHFRLSRAMSIAPEAIILQARETVCAPRSLP